MIILLFDLFNFQFQKTNFYFLSLTSFIMKITFNSLRKPRFSVWPFVLKWRKDSIKDNELLFSSFLFIKCVFCLKAICIMKPKNNF